MQPCNRIYYSTVYWRLNMFRAAYWSSSGALTVFAASGLHTHVVTGRSQVWVGTQFPLRLDYGRSTHGYINQRLQVQLELLMMSGMPLETCWAINERWNNKFYYKFASCWLFLLKYIISYHIHSNRYLSYRLCWLSASEIRMELSSILILLADSQHNLYDKYLLQCIQHETPDDGQ